jgi:hypothetical protein
LQGLPDSLESLSAAGLGKGLGIAKGAALPERGQGLVGLLSAVQIPILKSAAELLDIKSSPDGASPLPHNRDSIAALQT